MTVISSLPVPVTFAGPSLSPSRAADFKTCPLLFRFRTIDKLPERPTPDQVRGTLVHAVLESLFDLPAADRTPAAAAALVAPSWSRLLTREPALADLFAVPESTPDSPHPTAPTTDTAPNAPAVTAGAVTAPAGTGAAMPGAAVPEAAVPEAAVPEAAVPEAAMTGAAVTGAAVTGAAVTGAAVPGAAVTSGSPAGGAVTTGDLAVGNAADGSVPSGSVASAGNPAAEALPGTEALAAREPAQLADFLAGAGQLLHGYFAVEDPTRLEPAERESLVNTLVDDQLLIRGYIDRLDVSPAGDLRVVDYKTGGAPREAFEGRALFQLKFYALVLWRTRGVVPRVLRLLYLKDAEICDYSPDAEELERFERTLIALSEAIERAKQDRDFRPKPSRLCGWCSHQAHCPEFGGTPPPYPEPRPAENDTPSSEIPVSAEPGPENAVAPPAG